MAKEISGELLNAILTRVADREISPVVVTVRRRLRLVY